MLGLMRPDGRFPDGAATTGGPPAAQDAAGSDADEGRTIPQHADFPLARISSSLRVADGA